MSNTYVYDEKGRQVERNIHLGLLGDHRTTFHFDDHDNPIEEIAEHISSESSDKQHTRYVYKYDAKGNWTEREVWSLEPNKDPQRSNVERRQITYYVPRIFTEPK